MFIYTFKASKIKFFAVVLLAVASLLALITLVPGYGDAGTVAAVTIDYNNIKTDEDLLISRSFKQTFLDAFYSI